MRFITIFLERLILIFGNFWGSSTSISMDTATSATSIHGTNEILDYNLVEGSTTLTTASAMSSALSDTDVHAYDINITQGYVESMNEVETNELIQKLETLKIEDKPKTLKKTLNNYHMKN